LLARSKWVIPRSNARWIMAREFSMGSTPPKLYHKPNETTGSFKPLRPLRRYFIKS